MRGERFLRKPDRQLRVRGASTPDVSFNQADLPSKSRHPESVTVSMDAAAAAECTSAEAEARAGRGGTGAISDRAYVVSVGRDVAVEVSAGRTGDAFDARGAFAAGETAGAFAGTAGAPATSAVRTAAFSVWAAATCGSIDDVEGHDPPASIASRKSPARTRAIEATFAGAGLRAAVDTGSAAVAVLAIERPRVRRRAPFTRSEIFFSESRRNLRSADSRYTALPVLPGCRVFFAGTEALLGGIGDMPGLILSKRAARWNYRTRQPTCGPKMKMWPNLGEADCFIMSSKASVP